MQTIHTTELIGRHTPGPWQLDDARSSLVYLVNDQAGRAVGEVVFADFRRPADALLVAAAPQLLAALELILADLNTELDPEARLIAQAAVDAAHGAREVNHA